MLSSTLWRALTAPVTYVLVAILIGTAIMQVKYVNKALQRFDSTQVIPVQFVMFTLSVILGSAILYRDFEKATADNVVKFIGGCLLTFFGVWLITSARSKHDGDDSEEEESDEEGEERIVLADQDPTETQYADGAPSLPQITRKPLLYGDSANDDTVDDSRRSSRVSFSEPLARPQTSRLTSSSSNQPPIRVVTSTPPSANLRSESEDTPLLRNPWKNSAEELLQAARHPGLQNATSSPVLPSEARVSTNNPRPPTPRSSTQSHFHTHPNQQQEPLLPEPERPFTPARHSISRMMPGPLLSPLSGGLSVIIADSLRRGVESPIRSRPFRRGRLGLRRSKSGSQGLVNRTEGSEGPTEPSTGSDTPQEVSKSFEPERSNWSGVTRARSLSNTLGDLFRGKRLRPERPDLADDEAGPSRS
jgi:hypothetical protein